MNPLLKKSALALASDLKNRSLTCTSLVSQIYDGLSHSENTIKAYISLIKEQALENADKIDALLDKGEELSPLAGLPIGIKDNICIQNTRTTCGSKMLENFIAPYDATVIEKINNHHLIPIGKCNMDEFAMGSSNENSAFFTTKNPWNTNCVPGGSSGGPAATVAARQVPLALGSDTGGSIRQPAAFCGITGLKPTYGRVSRYGLVAFASSLDQIGPMATSVEDAAHLLNIICGFDHHDSTSSTTDVPDFTQYLKPDVKGLKIGVPEELIGDQIAPDIREAVINALDLLKQHGATWDTIKMDSFPLALSTYYILAPAEASANLARYDGVRYTIRDTESQNLKDMIKKTRGAGFGAEVKRRIILGTYVLSSGYYDAYYLKAQKARTLLKQDFEKATQQFDVLISPTTPTPAFKMTENTTDPLKMYLADIATIPVNLTGLPAVSIPCGFSNGLPIGLQIIGKAFDEAKIIQTGYTYQQLTDFHKQTPPANKGAFYQ